MHILVLNLKELRTHKIIGNDHICGNELLKLSNISYCNWRYLGFFFCLFVCFFDIMCFVVHAVWKLYMQTHVFLIEMFFSLQQIVNYSYLSITEGLVLNWEHFCPGASLFCVEMYVPLQNCQQWHTAM